MTNARPTQPSRTRRTALTAAAALALALAAPLLFAPAASASTPTPEDLGPRLAAACARVPNAIIRTENLQERLAGDVDTRGSLLWLADLADRADARDRPELAEALRNRLDVRTEIAGTLEVRLERLQEATVACDEADADSEDAA